MRYLKTSTKTYTTLKIILIFIFKYEYLCMLIHIFQTCLKISDKMKHKPKVVLDNKELENFALQIAEGMEHLEKLEIVHR